MSEQEETTALIELVVLTRQNRDLAVRLVRQMTPRERRRGLDFVQRMRSSHEDVLSWVQEVGDRMLQDLSNAET